MDAYPQISFLVGMPNMVPDQLSEVELLKIFAEFQWTQLGAALSCPPHRLVNDAGDRLYASVVQVESFFGPNNNISRFQEGDEVHARGHVQFYGGQFVEGWAVLGKEEVPCDTVAAITTKADLAQVDLPWIYMTNAIVARLADNTRLKTFRPAGIEELDVPQAPEKPAGLVEHEQAMQDGVVPPLDDYGQLAPLHTVDDSPITYTIAIENDLNGAGLLYFARYVAMMNYAERTFLLCRLHRPFSLQLNRFLSTEHRRSYFFGNAAETDQVDIRCTGFLIDPTKGPQRSSGTRAQVLRFLFHFDLYRKSDGVLMAKSVVSKALTIPNRLKGLHAEAKRFARSALDHTG